MFTIFFTILFSITQTPTPSDNFSTTCRNGFEKTLGQIEGNIWLGSCQITLNNSGLEPLTNRCLEEGLNPPNKYPLSVVSSDYANQAPPPITQQATLVAWVRNGIICIGLNANMGDFEKSLLHLIEDSDGEEVVIDEWSAYSVRSFGTIKNEWIKAPKDQ